MDNGNIAAQSESLGRILVVDDNRDATATLSLLLRLQGHDTATAYDGVEALRQAEAFRPDVILLDIGLPGMNGYAVACAIRERNWEPRAVLVATTGWGQEHDRRRALDAGFDHHLVKPVDPSVLARVLASVKPAAVTVH